MSVFRFGTVRSPPRRPTIQGSEQSPFCTSPSQLQEVTLDPNASANATIPFTLGLRSPGKTSPIRGRTMKEYEDQLSQLKKENFNLKLRIYFLEERMGHMSSADDKEDPVKKNIELKVEAETLRKEVCDKQELLCQAAKALDLMEEQHRGELRKIHEERDLEKGMLESRIQELEAELKDTKFLQLDSTALISEAFGLGTSTCVERHTHEEVEKLQKHIEALEAQIQQLDCALQDETVHSKQLEADLQETQQENERARVRCQGLELEMKQRDNKLEDLVQELEQKGQDLAGCNLRIRTLEEALSAKEPEIQIKVQELCERDRIIEEKQTQIDQQNKVLVEIQITLDEKQRQIEALRSSLADRDTSIAGLEGRLAKSKANIRNLEAKLDAAIHEGNRLREELATVKIQQKRMNSQSREHLKQELGPLSPLRRKGSNISSMSDEMASSSRHSRQSSEDRSTGTVRKQLSDLKEKETPKIVEYGHNQEVKAQREGARQEVKALEAKMKQLETELQNAACKLLESEKKLKEKEDKLKKLEEDNLKHYHAVKCFMQRTKDMGREIDQLKSESKKKDRCICDLKSELNELKDAYNKAIWEASQLQAQAQVQGRGGMPGAFEDVRDMTEEENERLWAEVEDKNKKLAEITKERDSLSNEMEKQVQALHSSLKEKEIRLEEFEKKAATSMNDLEARDNRIKELEEDLSHLRKELCTLQAVRYEAEGRGDTVEISNDVSGIKDNKNSSLPDKLVMQLEDKNREVERLNGELRKRTNNLQELVNKELWDKNREIEKLQDRLKSTCERKELEIMSLQQQICTRDFQLKMLQEKVAELGTHSNILPSSLMVREFQQLPVTFNQHMHFQHTSLTSGESLKNETGDISRGEFGTASAPSVTCAAKDEVTCLRDQLQASVEEKKYLCCKVEELREKLRNTPERDNDSRALRSECTRLRDDLDRANVWRKEAEEACALLTKRLEELARFLSSLLKHPERLGNLRAKHRQLLEQAVERSMELSRSLSVSLCTNKYDRSNGSLPPLMDSFSSVLMSASDINLSIIDLLGEDEGETSSCNPVQPENSKSGTSSYEATLTPSSQCCRGSGSNSEIAQLQRMNGSIISADNFVSRDKVVAEQAQVISQLRSQVETLTHEIKQRDIEFVRLQKDELNVYTRAEAAVVISGPKTDTAGPSRHSNTSSGSVWKPSAETETLMDVEGTKSLSSMTFYNSHHLSSNLGEQWSIESQTVLPTVGKNSVLSETKALLETVSGYHQEKCAELSTHVRSPAKSTTAVCEGVAMDAGRSVPKKQDQFNSAKSLVRYRMCRSASASAVALNQLQQPVHHHDVGTASLSESEAWSEPDRNVSLSRIGLNKESSQVLLSPGTGVNGCIVAASTRTRNSRIIQEEADTSESSEETAHETSRTQVKRGRSDGGEVRRLQNRLRAQEQVNEALRAELTILHQLAPPTTAVVNSVQSSHDMNVSTRITSEEKLDKSTSIEKLDDKGSSNVSSVTIPVQLLDQIRFQREKLESSLCHNDLIRHQLEGLVSSLSNQGDDNMTSLWQKMKDTSEQLEEARHQNQELETRLQEIRVQLEESREKVRLATAVSEQLQVTRQTVSILQEQMSSLESRLQEKDNEILERKCLMLELENQTKQQSMETEKMVQEAVTLKEEAERQLLSGERMKLEGDNKLQEAQKLLAEAERAKSEAEGQMIAIKKKSEDADVWIKDAEIQTGMLRIERESILREREAIQKDREITQIEKDAIIKDKEMIQREREIIEYEKKSLVNMQKEMKERMINFESLVHDAEKQKDEAEKQIMAAKKKIQEAKVIKEDAERKLKAAEEMDLKTKEMKVQLNQQLFEAKRKLEESECVSKAEMEKKVHQVEKLSQESQAELRWKIEEVQKREGEIRAEADTKIKDIAKKSKEREMELKKQLQESERHCREKECELIKKLDEVTLTASQAALDRTRLANEKLRLEQEVRRHEAREAELAHEKKDTENCLLVAKEQLEKQMALLQQQKNGLEKRVKELEAANLELMLQLDTVHIKEQSLSTSGGPESSCLTHMKIGRASPSSYSSGLDLLTGEGGSLPGSPWGTTATVSLEYNGSQNEDKDGSRRGSYGGRSAGLAAVSSMVHQPAFGRQRSELSDYMSEDQALEEYGALFTQTCNSSYWVTSLTEQHSTPSNSVPGDPSLMRNINSSPDLGIESDQGRFSSLEATSSGIQTDTPKTVGTLERRESGLDSKLSAVVISSGCDTAVRTYKELEQENLVLKRRLARTHHALEDTLAQLTAANQRKKQVERAICKQLHKTHHILKKVRVNLDAGTVDVVSPSAEEMD